MHASHRVRAALATLVAGGALAACGGGPEDPPPGAGTGSGLGAARFAALDAVLAAQRAAGEANPGELAAAARPAVEACARLDSGDRLLGAFRRLCPVLSALAARLAGTGDCGARTPEACLALIDRARDAARRFISLGRDADRAVARASLRAACARALTTPRAAYDVVAELEGGLAELERAVRAGSAPAVGRARARLGDAAARSDALPGAAETLARFRAACA